MFIERTHTTQIDTKDPLVLYSIDLKESLKNILTARYVGKCFKRCYILEIVEIIKHSPIICECNRNGGSARIAMTFKIKGIIYDRYEVIPDAKIVEILEDGKIILRSKYSAIMLKGNPKLQHYKIGQMVPVRALDAKYMPLRHVISVQGIPFVPLKEVDKDLEVQITADDQLTIEPMLKKLEEEQKKFDSLDKKTQTKWNNILNPSKQKPPAGFTSIDITKVQGSGRIIRPDWTELGDTTVWWKEEKREGVIKNSVQVLKGYINQMIKSLNTANMLAELYDVDTNTPWMDVYKKEL